MKTKTSFRISLKFAKYVPTWAKDEVIIQVDAMYYFCFKI